MMVGIILGLLATPAQSQTQCPEPVLYELLPRDYPCPLIRICSTDYGICLIPYTIAPGTPCQCQASNGTWVFGLCVR
jgi:hypothetical protein